jgi:RNA polymerase sigma-70 factor (ECF subfamily)
MGNGQSRISDERLFIRYSRGDTDAFGELMDRYAVRLLRYCRSFVRSEDEAEDLVQETFLKAIRSADSYRASARFSTWIYTIARNLCFDRLKAQKVRRRLWEGHEHGLVESTMGEAPLRPDEGLEVLSPEMLEAALGVLSTLEQETVRLTFFSGWNTAQIAELQECSRATVRVRRFKALEKMRGALLSEDRDGIEFGEELKRHEKQ